MRRIRQRLESFKASQAEKAATRAQEKAAELVVYEKRHRDSRLRRERAQWTEMSVALGQFAGSLLLVSNFYGDEKRAESIAESLSERVPRDARLGFSVHLSEERIDDGVGNVVGDFESNVTALYVALQNQGFTNVEEPNHSHTLISRDGLTSQSLAQAARYTHNSPVRTENGYVHLAVVSALDTERLGLPYDARGGTHVLNGFNPENGAPVWGEIDSLHIASPIQWMSQLAIEAENAVARHGRTPALDAAIDLVNSEIDHALRMTHDPMAKELENIQGLPEIR